MLTDTHKEVSFTRTFDAPRELVWKAWTDASLVKQWWGPNGVFIPECEIDPKAGGLMYLVMEAGEELGAAKGMRWPMKGQFTEVTEPEKIVFTANAIMNDKPVLEHTTTVTLVEKNGKTEMTVDIVVTKAMPGSEQAIAGMQQGWNQQLDKLVMFVQQL